MKFKVETKQLKNALSKIITITDNKNLWSVIRSFFNHVEGSN